MAKTTTILDPSVAALAVKSLQSARIELAQLAEKYKAMAKSVKTVEEALLATVESRGAFVADGFYVGTAIEEKVKKTTIGYQELIDAVTIYNEEMGKEVAMLAETALDDKETYNAANPERNVSLVIRPANPADGVITFSTTENGQIQLAA